MPSFLLKFTLVPNSALLFLKLLVFEFRLGISETSGYSALVPHANSVPLLDFPQLLMTFVGMLTYSRPDMFFWIACFNVFNCINSNVIIK
jgi:hypothetical protein